MRRALNGVRGVRRPRNRHCWKTTSDWGGHRVLSNRAEHAEGVLRKRCDNHHAPFSKTKPFSRNCNLETLSAHATSLHGYTNGGGIQRMAPSPSGISKTTRIVGGNFFFQSLLFCSFFLSALYDRRETSSPHTNCAVSSGYEKRNHFIFRATHINEFAEPCTHRAHIESIHNYRSAARRKCRHSSPRRRAPKQKQMARLTV